MILNILWYVFFRNLNSEHQWGSLTKPFKKYQWFENFVKKHYNRTSKNLPVGIFNNIYVGKMDSVEKPFTKLKLLLKVTFVTEI